MIKNALLAALLLSLTANAQISVTRIKRQLETSKPQEIQLDLRRGETVDFDLQFLSYGAVMDLIGSTVTLHAVTNGMPAGTSFQISGMASSNGTASVRISVDDWLPYQLTSGTWTLECALPTASRIMRASGVVKLSGLYYPSTNSPLPVTWSTNFWTAISAIQSKTNDWNASYAWGDHAAAGYLSASTWLTWLSTNTYVKVESDPTVPAHVKAITELQVTAWDAGTNRSDRTYTLYGYTNAWQTVENGTATVWRIENGADISSAILSVTEPLTIDGGLVVLPIGVYTSIVESAGVFIWSHNGAAFGYYTYSPGIPLTSCLLFEDDSSAWYGHNGNTGTYVFPDVMTNLYGTAIGGKVTVDYGQTIVTNAYPLTTADMQTGISATQVTNIVRTVVHSNQLWSAAGTNAIYQVSWDATNGTWMVQEILP